MNFETYISHYFEKQTGPLLSICDLDVSSRNEIIQRECDAVTGFNRFAYGEEFFDFRELADDLLIDLYTEKFGQSPARRPYFGVLGDADVVGGLYREPCKIMMPVSAFAEHELTIMCPDHFHLVSLSGREVNRYFGVQIPSDYSEEAYPYYGKLLTCAELQRDARALKIEEYLAKQKRENSWYRYLEVQIWADPETLRQKYSDWIEVEPEPWCDGKVTHLQNYRW